MCMNNSLLQIPRLGRVLDLSRPHVMGILNVTPDSFSDGGRYDQLDCALRQVEAMLEEGADFIDIGGESTRPGAAAVTLDEERERVLPVIEAISERFETLISIDTMKPELMRDAVEAGAVLINDVNGLQAEGAIDAVVDTGAAACIMHMQGKPRTMQAEPQYDDVVAEVSVFLEQRVEACETAGISRNRLCIDPGIGFGKTLEHNLALLKALPAFMEQAPVLLGVSRKSMIGALLDNAPVDQRLYGSVAVATVAAWQGAGILRVHDVRATVDALRIAEALRT